MTQFLQPAAGGGFANKCHSPPILRFLNILSTPVFVFCPIFVLPFLLASPSKQVFIGPPPALASPRAPQPSLVPVCVKKMVMAEQIFRGEGGRSGPEEGESAINRHKYESGSKVGGLEEGVGRVVEVNETHEGYRCPILLICGLNFTNWLRLGPFSPDFLYYVPGPSVRLRFEHFACDFVLL